MTTTIRKNRNGHNYSYTDIAAVNQFIESTGQSYYQEVETENGHDYIVTHVLDATGKEIRKCRGCRIPPLPGGKNPAQELGSALTYSRRYSLLLAFGLATSDDDGAALNPVKRDKKAVKPDWMTTEKALDESPRTAVLDRTEAVNRISLLVNSGKLALEEVQATVRKYGAAKMNELSDDAFAECVATLTKSA